MPRKPQPFIPPPEAFGIDVHALAARALGRAAGADPTDGNAVRMLLDSRENFPAWLHAIRGAQHQILFESYILSDDDIGQEFANALRDRARDGVDVYVICDWLGSFRSKGLWLSLRDAGVKVAVFNPFQFTSPLGWISRDHRKMIAIDGTVGFVSGLCVSRKWLGNPVKRMEPWRDTGVEIRGPAVADLERAFDQVWQATGEPPLPPPPVPADKRPHVGRMRVRVLMGQPAEAGAYRMDLMIAALAHKRLWLTDAYFVGTAPYVQALRAAAQDGVDVRLLVPGASDIPAVSVLSRAGYRALLDAGVRVYEWNGTMLHAKTAVADSHWSRIGSTNLNLASFLGNYELDVAIEDESFAEAMASQFEADLTRSTEIVLTTRNRLRRAGPRAQHAKHARRASGGSASRAAAGAAGVGSALGAALTNRRGLGPAESSVLVKMALFMVAFGAIAALWPRAIAWPVAAITAWTALSWLVKAWSLKRSNDRVRNLPERDVAEPEHEQPVPPAAPVPGDKGTAEPPSDTRRVAAGDVRE